MKTTMTPRVQALLSKQMQRVRDGIKPVLCPKIEGQLSLAEYPQIDDRFEDARRKAQLMDYRHFWGSGNDLPYPEIKEQMVEKKEWSLSAIVALGRQTVMASLP